MILKIFKTILRFNKRRADFIGEFCSTWKIGRKTTYDGKNFDNNPD